MINETNKVYIKDLNNQGVDVDIIRNPKTGNLFGSVGGKSAMLSDLVNDIVEEAFSGGIPEKWILQSAYSMIERKGYVCDLEITIGDNSKTIKALGIDI